MCIRTFEKKQTKNERWKGNHRRKTNYFIEIYATFQMSNLTVLRDDQEMTWKVGVCNRPQKQEDAVFLAPIIVLK